MHIGGSLAPASEFAMASSRMDTNFGLDSEGKFVSTRNHEIGKLALFQAKYEVRFKKHVGGCVRHHREFARLESLFLS